MKGKTGYLSTSSSLFQQITQTNRTSRPAKPIRKEKQGIYQHSQAYFSEHSKPVVLVGPPSRYQVKNNVFGHTNRPPRKNLSN